MIGENGQLPTSEPRPVAMVPTDFICCVELVHPKLDRRLGYPGSQRFVLFCYARNNEVVWWDGRERGYDPFGWTYWIEHVVPLAEEYGVDISGDDSTSHVLLIDRLAHEAYFAPRGSARRLVDPRVACS